MRTFWIVFCVALAVFNLTVSLAAAADLLPGVAAGSAVDVVCFIGGCFAAAAGVGLWATKPVEVDQ